MSSRAKRGISDLKRPSVPRSLASLEMTTTRVTCTCATVSTLLQLYRIHMTHPAEQVRAEDQPLAIRRERAVGLQVVIVLGHVHQPLAAEHAGLDQARRGDFRCAAVGDQLGAEEVDPLSVLRMCDHPFAAAV